MSYVEAKKQIEMIEGFLSDAETKCLYKLAKNCGGDIVEIGSWKGKSTICLALGSKAGNEGKVFAIDPHEELVDKEAGFNQQENTEPIFRKNIKKVNDIVVSFVMKSEETNKGWTKPISLLWIDGAHDYENVKKDFLLWNPHLKKGGVIAFHDAIYSLGHTYSGVRKVVYKHILKSRKFSNVQFCGSIVFATKIKSHSPKSRKIVLFLFLPLIHSIYGQLVHILIKTGLIKPAKWMKNKIKK